MSKHTPAPWHICDCHLRTAVNAGNKHIAMVNYFRSVDAERNVFGNEHDANAKLIAAAPELYLALDQLLRVTVDEDLKYGIQLTEAEQEAREYALAVIAKAIID